jgi:hypothetical protein
MMFLHSVCFDGVLNTVQVSKVYGNGMLCFGRRHKFGIEVT